MTAEEARLIAKAKNEQNTDLEFCLNKIKHMAGAGCFKAVVNARINHKAQDRLKELGYEVKEDEYNDLYIKW